MNGQTYYYLIYSYREGKLWKHIEKSLGPLLPSLEDLRFIKSQFISDVFQNRWEEKLQIIQTNYMDQLNQININSPLTKIQRLRAFGIRFTHNSNRIEGSSLTYQNVVDIIEHNVSPPLKPLNDILEARAHMKTYEEMLELKDQISLDLLLHWHKSLFQQTKSDIAGSLRKGPIFIAGSKHIPPSSGLEVEILLEELMHWYAENQKKLHPVLLACLIHYRFESIHPFEDGNGRVGRLLMNYILFQNQFPLFDIDFKSRISYIHALERANVKNDDLHFVQWFMTHYIRANRIIENPE